MRPEVYIDINDLATLKYMALLLLHSYRAYTNIIGSTRRYNNNAVPPALTSPTQGIYFIHTYTHVYLS
jgi:hypothetical protein